MKPFNLQEALAGKPVVTDTGQRVTDLHRFKTASDYCIYGVVETETARDRPDHVGMWTTEGCSASGRFLSMPTTKKTGWINIYKGFNGVPTTTGCVLHETKELAEHNGKVAPNWLSTAKLEWEE